jgi:hypothetical protein
MGYWKEQMIEEQERGWSSPGDKFACSHCFNDKSLAKFALESAEAKRCDYCGRSSKRNIAVHIDLIMEKISEALWTEWGHPDNEGVLYETAEGGYQGTVYDTADLFYNVLEKPFENSRLLQDVINSFTNQGALWCQKHFYELRPQEVLKYGWEEFTKVVKHETRYLFSVAPDGHADSRGHEEIPPAIFLERLAELVSEVNLIKILPKGTHVFRARVHDPHIVLSTAKELGPPPADLARFSNRMSPAGLPDPGKG